MSYSLSLLLLRFPVALRSSPPGEGFIKYLGDRLKGFRVYHAKRLVGDPSHLSASCRSKGFKGNFHRGWQLSAFFEEVLRVNTEYRSKSA